MQEILRNVFQFHFLVGSAKVTFDTVSYKSWRIECNWSYVEYSGYMVCYDILKVNCGTCKMEEI